MRIDADMHIHTRYCGHAEENMNVRQIIDQAERRGLQTIAITDHVRVGSCKEDTASLANIMKEVRSADNNILRSAGSIPRDREPSGRSYRPACSYMRSISGRSNPVARHGVARVLHILIGAEIDADPFHKGRLVLEDESVLRKLDFVYGSIHHWSDDGAIWYTEKSLSAAEKTRAIDDYFIWYEKLSRNPLIDVMAHPGVFLPATFLITDFDHTICERFVPILNNMKKTGKKFELNELASSKMGQQAWATYGRLVGLAQERDIPFIIGSDAHSLEQIGQMPNVTRLVDASGSDHFNLNYSLTRPYRNLYF